MKDKHVLRKVGDFCTASGITDCTKFTKTKTMAKAAGLYTTLYTPFNHHKTAFKSQGGHSAHTHTGR